jgi:shikimate dehydrogenase
MMGKIYGVIGHPIGHSMSPMMHNDAFKQLGLDYYYHAFDVEPTKLSETVDAMKLLGIAGFNVTIPHKVTIIEYLDEIDDEAKEIGAVNTVKNDNGRLTGYNTDGRGFFLSLKRLIGEDQLNNNMLIIGAGGAARGILAALARSGFGKVDVANRTVAKAEYLLDQVRNNNSNGKPLSLGQAEAELKKYDVVINTTSVGMSPNVNDIPLSLDNMKPGTVLSDIIYNPLETNWLKIGRQKHAIVQNGVGMFAGQGAIAFEIWTGMKPDIKRMEEIVTIKLGG